MTDEEMEFLQSELIEYVSDVGYGKDLDVLGKAIRIKINQLNVMINSALDDENTSDYHFLIGMAYQYYNLLYG